MSDASVTHAMYKPLVALLAGWAFVLGACGSTSTPQPERSGAGGAGASSFITVPVVVGSGGCADIPAAPEADAGADPLCAGASPDVSFQHDVLPLVHCSGEQCHQAWTYGTLVGHASHTCCDRRPLVAPGQPSASHLVQAISDDAHSCVGRMGDLDAAQIAIVVAWVCEGAPNN